MKLTPKTITLAVIALLLLGLNFLDSGTGHRIADQLPTIPQVVRGQVTRIEVSTAVQKVVIEGRTEAGSEEPVWYVKAPVAGKADQAAVRSLLKVFRKDVPLDVKVDSGNQEDYGLEPGQGILFEAFTSAVEPDISFTIGRDAPGGSSFVRLSGAEDIFRARVGGRHRYEKSPAEWRNRVLLDFDGAEAIGLSTTREGAPMVDLVRELVPGAEESAGPWRVEPDPGWPADQLAIEAIVKKLGTLRAGELLGRDFDGGFDPPLATIAVRLADGTERGLKLGRRDGDGAFFVQANGEPDAYRVARSPLLQALRPVDGFRDRTMFAFGRPDVDTMTYREGGIEVILQQDLANGLWRVIQPAHFDVDIKYVFFAVNTLATLRADGLVDASLADAGLDTPRSRIIVRLLDGQEFILMLGDTMDDGNGGAYTYARTHASTQVYLLSKAQVDKLKEGFGRKG